MSFLKEVRNITAKALGGSSLARLLMESASNGRGTKRGLDELIHAYNDTPAIHAPMARIGNDVASLPWQVYKISAKGKKKGLRSVKGLKPYEPDPEAGAGALRVSKNFLSLLEEGDLELVPQHPLLGLLERPNPQMTGWEMMKLNAVYLKHVGEIFLMKQHNDHGIVKELWVVPPHWVSKIPSRGSNYFELLKNGMFNRKVPVEEMVWTKDPDPENPYGRGTSASWALGDEIDIDDHAAQHTRARFENSAMPELLIGVEGAHEADLRDAKSRWENSHRGPRKGFQTHWHSGKLQVEQLTPSMQEMQLLELRKGERNIILQTIGMPPETLGIIENSNRSTIDAADYFYTKRVLLPLLYQLWWMLQYDILPGVAPGDADTHIITHVNPVPDDKEHQSKLLKTAPQILTKDEWRKLVGHGPLPPGKGGDELYEPKNATENAPGGGDDLRDDESRDRDRDDDE